MISSRDDVLIHALTLDLDDTLWAIAPVIERAETALHVFLQQHAPRTAACWSPAALRELRERIAQTHPHWAHDFTAQRRLCLQWALREGGDDPALADPAFEAFAVARNTLEPYPDVEPALQRLAGSRPLAALTNGNADLDRIGLGRHFRFSLGAREHGVPKPDPSIFLAACARLDRSPEHVLHVGDDPHLDIAGAAQIGQPTCWVNRRDEEWPDTLPPPTLEVTSLTALADWLDAHAPSTLIAE